MTEDLSIFLDDFGVLCNGVRVLFEEPDGLESLGYDGVQAPGPTIIFTTGSLILTAGQAVEIEGRFFKVRAEPRRIDDGKFSEARLK